MASHPPNCPACGKNLTSPSSMFRGGAWGAWECGQCGVHFIWPVPSEETLSEQYLFARYASVSYPSRTSGSADRTAMVADLLAFAEGRPPKLGRLLDVGCSTGTFLEVARGRGWRVDGIERDPETALRTSRRLGIRIEAASDLTSLPPNRRFDLIVLSHVLEHVRDPRDLLLQVASHLDVGARVLVRVPNRESRISRTVGRLWSWYCPPIHLSYFSRASLDRLLKDCRLLADRWQMRKGDAQSLLGELLYALSRMFGQTRRRQRRNGGWPEGPSPGPVNSPRLRRAREFLEGLLSLFPVGTEDAELIVVAYLA